MCSKGSCACERGLGQTSRSSSLPQKPLLLKHLVRSVTFSYVTSWHQPTPPCHTFTSFTSKRLVWHVIFDFTVVSGAGSGVRELTNQSSLKGQQLMQSSSDRGGIQSCGTGLYEKTDLLFESLNAFRPCLVATEKQFWAWDWTYMSPLRTHQTGLSHPGFSLLSMSEHTDTWWQLQVLCSSKAALLLFPLCCVTHTHTHTH